MKIIRELLSNVSGKMPKTNLCKIITSLTEVIHLFYSIIRYAETAHKQYSQKYTI